MLALLKQVLEKDFAADGNKYDSAECFNFTFKKVADVFADEYAGVRESESYQADD